MICTCCERPTAGVTTTEGTTSAMCPRCASEQSETHPDFPSWAAVDADEMARLAPRLLTKKGKKPTT